MPLSNPRVCSVTIAGCLLSAATIFAASDGNSTGDMDLNEIGVLDEVNLARTKPAEYANYVEEHRKNFKGFFVVVIDGRKSTRTVEGIKAVDEAIAFLRTAEPVAALSPSRALTLAARDHVKDLGPRGTTGHIGTDNSQPTDRIRRYGTPKSVSGEDITFGTVSARSIVVQLIVDDGVAGRDHRKSLFEPDYRLAGIAIGPHTTYEQICVMDFADSVDQKR